MRIAGDHRLLDTVFERTAAVVTEFVIVQVLSHRVDDVLSEVQLLALDILHQILVVETAVLVGLLDAVGDHVTADRSHPGGNAHIALGSAAVFHHHVDHGLVGFVVSADGQLIAVFAVVGRRNDRFRDAVDVDHVGTALGEHDRGHLGESVEEDLFPERFSLGHIAEDVGQFEYDHVHTAVGSAAADFDQSVALFAADLDIGMPVRKMLFGPDPVEVREVGVEQNGFLDACLFRRFEYGDDLVHEILVEEVVSAYAGSGVHTVVRTDGVNEYVVTLEVIDELLFGDQIGRFIVLEIEQFAVVYLDLARPPGLSESDLVGESQNGNFDSLSQKLFGGVESEESRAAADEHLLDVQLFVVRVRVDDTAKIFHIHLLY